MEVNPHDTRSVATLPAFSAVFCLQELLDDVTTLKPQVGGTAPLGRRSGFLAVGH